MIELAGLQQKHSLTIGELVWLLGPHCYYATNRRWLIYFETRPKIMQVCRPNVDTESLNESASQESWIALIETYDRSVVYPRR